MSAIASRLAALVVLSSLLLAAAPRAEADEQTQPYKIRLVVHVARHRLLTDVFVQQLRRELKDHLQAALGKLAKVEVTDKHDRLADVTANGLQKSLDAWREQTGEKVCFVLIDFDGTRYEIQTRQYDGDLRLPSPGVRRERTRDRAYVARTAALLIEQDVGLIGTILSEPDAGKVVKVQWRGSGLGVDLGKWVKKGEVLLVANPRPNTTEPTLPWTLLRVETAPKVGVSECVLFSRYKMVQATGMKVMLVGTREGPLRLRLVQAKKGGGGYENIDNDVRLAFRRDGFEGEAPLTRSGGGGGAILDTAKDGDKGRFDRVAFLSVLSRGGDTVKAKIPIALLDDRPIMVPVPTGDDPSEALDGYRSLARNTLGASEVLAQLFKEINALTAKADKRGEALKRVRETLRRSQDDYQRLKKELADVEEELKKLQEKDRPNLVPIETQLKQIASTEGELLRLVGVLEKIEKEEQDPRRKEWRFQIEAARGHEKEADVDKALEIYEKKELKEFSPPELDRHVEKLKKQWVAADAGHEKARRFIYKTYPGLTTDGLATEARWKEVTDALETCKKAGDRWGPLKLIKATERHAERLRAEAATLKPQLNPDDEKPAKVIADLLPKIIKLLEDAGEYLAGLKE